jgi:lipopolysaccharide export system permease protein
MIILDRYLYKQFARNLLLVCSGLISVYLLIDFFERIDNFHESHKSIGLALKYFIYKIPTMYNELSPVCIMLAGIVTIGLLNHNREMTALKAGGISFLRIVKPILKSALFFTFVSLASAQWLLPATTSVINRIWHEEVRQKMHSGIVRNGRVYYKGSKGIYSFIRPDPKNNNFIDFTYLAIDKKYTVNLFITAQKASWQNQWHLEDGQIFRQTTGNKINIEKYNELNIKLPDPLKNFFVPAYKVTELSLGCLAMAAIKNLRDGDRRNWVELNRRLSYIFLGFPLVLMGIPVVIIVHYNWGHDLTMALPMSSGLAFAAWGIWSANQAMTNAAYINPVVASWLIHFVIGGIGFYMIRRQDVGNG